MRVAQEELAGFEHELAGDPQGRFEAYCAERERRRDLP
jgi:hypothetical protein